MSRTIHINLLNDLERKSSSPVRWRIVAPVVAAIALVSMLGWWYAIQSHTSGINRAREEISEKIESSKEGRRAFEEASARKAAADNEVSQLDSYVGSRAFFGGFLAKFAAAVPPTMQLTRLSIPMPQRPVAKTVRRAGGGKAGAKGAAQAENKATTEKVSVEIAGIVDSAKSVETLRLAMLSDAFTNIVVSAEIPAGSFRMATTGRGEEADSATAVFNFDLRLECKEREFK